ncbi:8986_t:CDS:2, partial [Funneliformis mosseae]
NRFAIIEQQNQFGSEFYELYVNGFNISICTGISNVMTLENDIKITNYTSHCQTVHINNYAYNRPFWFNITTAPSNNNDNSNNTQHDSKYPLNPYELSIPSDIPDNMLFLSFESIKLQFDDPKPIFKKYSSKKKLKDLTEDIFY